MPGDSNATAVASLERLLAAGKDGAMLRFGLGSAHLNAGDAHSAVDHLQRAVSLDPGYSAAWKLLGKALSAVGRDAEALTAYRAGIAAADKKGDKQAMKEMQVFARRLAKQMGRE